MSVIKKGRIELLGYNFIPTKYLSDNDEYTQRNKRFFSTSQFRKLNDSEISVLKDNQNTSSSWDDILVTDKFIPEQIQNTKFYGFVRIGDMENVFLDYRDLKLPTGIYNSTVVSCDLGNTVAIHNVRYLAHFIIGNDVMLVNINEMETNSGAKFGNGILKDGDVEERRIRLELCNENGGRSVLPFDGMQASDVYLWSRNRHDNLLQERFVEMMESQFSKRHGYYSEVGDRCVIKNTHIIKDVKIGTDAYIKGVNKLKNLTINSSSAMHTQIGEGCELVNGIIGYGCRIFYGVKAVRFVLSSNSQLKYGARLINSFLGDNSTISCCEVLNSLIFPAHEQHHNNSFLCASLIKGQSNMAAGATVGSNHSSRAADGEIVAGRGFWPGLCVSLKHNSRFASYTLIVKGNFMHEMDIRLPFSLVSNDIANDKLVIIPAYWFLYNMYALIRNVSKFEQRDKRLFKNQRIEYEVLAPDTINEMFAARSELEEAAGRSCKDVDAKKEELQNYGKEMLKADRGLQENELMLTGVEYSKRKVVVLKPKKAYDVYERMIKFYAAEQIIAFLKDVTWMEFQQQLKGVKRNRAEFENVGGQLIPTFKVDELLKDIRIGKVKSWSEAHEYYKKWSKEYTGDKLHHALASLAEITDRTIDKWDKDFIGNIIKESVLTKRWMFSEIVNSRLKDYENPFKQMVYENPNEMQAVIGNLENNSFIKDEKRRLEIFELLTASILAKIKGC
ncbi:DUF4954 family protein [Sphingobacterium sp. UT-1RO-CII-1]|uniref:DUF4954 family protein n=1 Tax=Sphingobacterium sp. UT-1RO-CII-1 TaxID=2995225 RepID=UPI00227AEFED|nr:DUF4954 family protein [Sphingobacterium sp. UT-1RO-CII-1]MCY4778030.1 DUF4954 family protein [Sphingobacterium sp. UT-1RO-CII-1]